MATKNTQAVKKAAKEATKKAADAVKETAAKAEKEVKDAAKAVKKTAKKAAQKLATKEVYFEFAGKQISVDEVTENAKKHWKASNNGTISDIKVYINTKESKAYYVVNNEDRGDFEL